MKGKNEQRVNKLLDLIFAPSCCICGNKTAKSNLPLCKVCIKSFQDSLIKPCPKCDNERKSCTCEKSGNTVFLFYYHSSDEKRCILNLKQSPDKRTAAFLGKLLAEKIKREKRIPFDCVTYVPRKPKSVRAYGGDQARLIAAGVAKGLGIPLVQLISRQNEKSSDQKLLDATERRKNVKNTFSVLPEVASYRRILLVDDVTTTGATIDQCASLLRSKGDTQVIKAVLARTP